MFTFTVSSLKQNDAIIVIKKQYVNQLLFACGNFTSSVFDKMYLNGLNIGFKIKSLRKKDAAKKIQSTMYYYRPFKYKPSEFAKCMYMYFTC